MSDITKQSKDDDPINCVKKQIGQAEPKPSQKGDEDLGHGEWN